MASCSLEDYSGARKVDIVVKKGLFDGRSDTGHGGQMDHGIGLFQSEKLLDQFSIPDVALNQRESFIGQLPGYIFSFNGRIVEVVETVKADNPLARAQKSLAKMGADETGTARYKYTIAQGGPLPTSVYLGSPHT